jgi:hypothetical protein
MDEWAMAEAIAHELNDAPWKAEVDCPGEIIFTNEHGERFTITVEIIEDDNDRL